MITAILTFFGSSAGGSIVGGVFGMFSKIIDGKNQREADAIASAERIESGKINLERDKMEYENAKAERDHAITMHEKGALFALQKVETETEAANDIAHMEALGQAQDVFANFKTDTKTDNYRALVRPNLAYWAAGLFTVILLWAFYVYRGQITQSQGSELLLMMISTVCFTVSSIVTFYFMARRNKGPKA